MTALPRWPDGRIPVLLSAHARELVAADARAILRFLDREPTVEAVAGTLLRTRRIRRHRAVVRAADAAELADGLRALAADRQHPLVARSAEGSAPRLAFVVPGQGNHWPAMGAEAYRRLPVYTAEADKCAEAFVATGCASPLRYLTTAEGEFSQIEVQAAQFTHAVALASVWRSCGILPDLTVGHSLGEVAAAYLADTVALRDAVAVVAARAEVVDGLPGRYGMAVLGVGAGEARELIAGTAGWLELSVVNGPAAVVVSGAADAIGAITESVAARGLLARQIPVNYPAHTSALEPLRDQLTSRLPRAAFTDSAVQFVGSATGAVVTARTDFTGHWYANLRNTVRFDRAVQTATRCSAKAFVELSAHPSLLFALGDLLDDELPDGPAVLVGSGHREQPLLDQLSANIAAAAVADPGYRWAGLLGPAGPPLRDFPNAPMRAVHLWATPQPLPKVPAVTVLSEKWEEQQGRSASVPDQSARPLRSVAVLDIGAGGALTAALRAAVDRHPGTFGAPAADADLVVAVAPAVAPTDPMRAAAALSDLIDRGLLNYVDAIGRRCRDVWLVTVGGEQVAPGHPASTPAHAALAALHRSVGFEHPDQRFHHLDLASWELPEATGTVLMDTLLTGTGEVALRGQRAAPVRYRRTLAAPDDIALPAVPWRLDGGVLDDVVITGGSGTIGLQYAHYLAERGARRIVLLSRAGADPAALAALTERHGVEVVSPPCDITDRERVSAVAAEFAGDGASLVIHAAGTATFATRDRLTGASLADMCAAKITGLAHLGQLWPLRPDTRMLLCSSVIGVWGGKGVGGYAAANRILDAMAAHLRAAGLRCTVVRWGLWEGSDIVDAAEIARVERSGLRQMAPVSAIEASLHEHPFDPLVLAADPDRLRMFVGDQGATETVDATDLPAAQDVDTARAVRSELASVLTVADATTLDLDASLFELGVDSLLALELRKRIKRATGRTVRLATLLGGITGTELIADLMGTGVPDRPERVETSRD